MAQPYINKASFKNTERKENHSFNVLFSWSSNMFQEEMNYTQRDFKESYGYNHYVWVLKTLFIKISVSRS